MHSNGRPAEMLRLLERQELLNLSWRLLHPNFGGILLQLAEPDGTYTSIYFLYPLYFDLAVVMTNACMRLGTKDERSLLPATTQAGMSGPLEHDHLVIEASEGKFEIVCQAILISTSTTADIKSEFPMWWPKGLLERLCP